jgi:hypothetical protein
LASRRRVQVRELALLVSPHAPAPPETFFAAVD